jgi:GNAT superfamily N-acetyltransferase
MPSTCRRALAGAPRRTVRHVRIDAALVRRLEASAAAASVETVKAMYGHDPSCSAVAEPFRSGALIAMGAGRYVNRAVGVTVEPLDSADLDTIEQYFDGRGVVPALELSSWAPPETVAVLRDRSYTPEWFRSMYALTTTSVQRSSSGGARIELVTDEHLDAWLDVLAAGNEVNDPVGRATSDEFARANHAMAGSFDFLAFVDDRAAGCGSVQIVDDVAWLGGAATLPASRGRGIQSALLQQRLRFVAQAGCPLAAATAVPTGASARNLQRAGFTHVQTQLVVSRRLPAPSDRDPVTSATS